MICKPYNEVLGQTDSNTDIPAQNMETVIVKTVGNTWKFILKTGELAVTYTITAVKIGKLLYDTSKKLLKEADIFADYLRDRKKVSERWASRLDGNLEEEAMKDAHVSTLSVKDMEHCISICGKLTKILKDDFSDDCLSHDINDPFLLKSKKNKEVLKLFEESGFFTVKKTKKFHTVTFRPTKWDASNAKRESLASKGWDAKTLEESLALSEDLADYIQGGDMSDKLKKLIDKNKINKIKNMTGDVDPKLLVEGMRRAYIGSIQHSYMLFARRVFKSQERLFEGVLRQCVYDPDEVKSKKKED